MTANRPAPVESLPGRDHGPGWKPLFLCQDFLGHSTHASLLEHYLAMRDEWEPEVARFSVRRLGHPAIRAGARIAGARIPVPVLNSMGLDLWATRTFLVQGSLAGSALRRAVNREPDLVYVHSHSAGRVLDRIPSATPVAVSVDSTIAAEQRMKRSRPFTFDRLAIGMERRILQGADMVIAFSDWARESVIHDCGVPPARVITIPNAVRKPGPVKIRRGGPPPFTTDLPVAGFVGNDFERKGGYRLLEAHQRYLADRVHLVLVTAHEVRGASLRNVTIFTNINREGLLAHVMPRFTLLAHPASLDWSPYAVIEALAIGLPVVATSVGALPEMVVDGENGILLPNDTPEAIADAIARIVANDALASHMARTSQARFAERFDADVNYPKLLEALCTWSR